MKEKCIFLDEWNNCDICEKLIKTKKDINGKPRKHLLTIEDISCEFYKDCHYKQKEKYKNALKEIKEIAKWHTTKADSEDVQEDMKQILQKINEVLNA